MMLTRRHTEGLTLAMALALGSCARHPAVDAGPSLPLRRVVVYRNGIGYFERAGHVEGDAVQFRVLQSEVGDFLATLAVMERGGSSVRSAAFPMPESSAADTPPGASSRRAVRLSLDGRGHDISVGYTVETPIWRPSYRLVFDAHGHAQLQAWGIVQNLSGEDWTNIRLSLVTGSPVSFRSELATAVIPPRPEVTDRGAVIDAVPLGETVLAQDEHESPPETTAAPREHLPVLSPTPSTGDLAGDTIADAMGTGGLGATGHGWGGGGEGYGSGAGRGLFAASRASGNRIAARQQGLFDALRAAPVGGTPQAPTTRPHNLAALAALAAQGGTTRYDLPNTVTIPDRSATMVMLVSHDIPGSQTYLFAPDAGVPDSSSHPFHVARFENRTGALLERGPLAIFERNAFLGEGLLEALPDGASASVPFALERGLSVDASETQSIEGARLIRIQHETITVERYNVTRTTYRVRNGLDQGAQVLVRRSMAEGVTLFDPPAGSEQSNGAALVPVRVGGHNHGEVVVATHLPYNQQVDWATDEAATAIRAYLADGHPLPAVATALQSALDLQTQLGDLRRQREGVAQRHADIAENTEETRQNLWAIHANGHAADLRAQLTTRLALLARQTDQITRQLVELDTNIGEKRVRLAETVREIDIDTTSNGHPAVHA